MGANAGPDIVSDGLVLALDAADNNSFRGEPTTNLITNPLPTSTTGFNRSGGTGTVTYDSTKGAVYWEQTAYASWGTYFNFHPAFNGTLDTGSQYTFSVEYLSENDFADSLFSYGLVQGNGQSSATSKGNITLNTTNLNDGWKRYSYTFTPANTGVGSAYSRFITGNRGTDVLRMYFRNIQFEKKSKRTRFTTGTRGTTVATGGGWADISGNSNHGEILNGTSTSNDNTVLGALDFDGTNDYIDLGTQFNSLTSFAVEGVFKTDLTSGDTYQNIWGAGPDGGTSDYTGIGIGNLTSGYSDESFHAIIGGQTYQVFVRNGSNFYFDNKYHHFVVNFEPGNNTVYIDGEQQSITYKYGNINTDTGGLNAITNNNTYIGRRSYPNSEGYFNGKIPLVRIYNRGLTELEAINNYNSLKSRFGL